MVINPLAFLFFPYERQRGRREREREREREERERKREREREREGGRGGDRWGGGGGDRAKKPEKKMVRWGEGGGGVDLARVNARWLKKSVFIHNEKEGCSWRNVADPVCLMKRTRKQAQNTTEKDTNTVCNGCKYKHRTQRIRTR